MKVLTGYSTNEESYKAGKEAAQMAGKFKDAKLVFAYI